MSNISKLVESEKGKDRWGDGIEHHPKSIELMAALQAVDSGCYGMYFDWHTGGDGDNGETLMFQMDAFFEMKDAEAQP